MKAGDVRKLIEGKPDDYEIPIYVRYGDIASNHIFVRVDDVTTETPPGILANPDDPPGICLCLSLVDEEDIEEDEDEDEEDEDEETDTHEIVAHIAGGATPSVIAEVNKLANHDPEKVAETADGTDITYHVQAGELDEIIDAFEESDIVDSYTRREI